MKFGFFLKGTLVDSCYAESIDAASSTVEFDAVYPIIDTSMITASVMNADSLTVEVSDPAIQRGSSQSVEA